MKNKLRVIGISLLVILISIIAFVGIYVKKANVWENIIPDFKFGMELNGIRELRYIVDPSSEEKNVYIDSEGNILGIVKEEKKEESEVSLNAPAEEKKEEVAVPKSEKINYATEVRNIKRNEDKDVNIENFEKTKKMIQGRIEKNQNFEYNIRQDSITGELIVEVPNKEEDVNFVENVIATIGTIEIIDEQTGIVLMDNSYIKKYSAVASNNSGYQAYLKMEFNKEGTEKLKEISKEYIETTNEAGEVSTKYISILLDGQTISTTYFGEVMPTGILQIPMGRATTDLTTYAETAKDVERIADVLNSGKLPIAYTLNSDDYIQSNIIKEDIRLYEIIFMVAIAIVSIYFIVKYKLNGVIGAILGVGYMAILILAVKYTNVIITLNSIVAFIVMVSINYIFVERYLARLKNNENSSEAFKNSMKRLYLNIIPVCIIAVIFTFVGNVIINSIGMMLFWGILLQFLYNLICTRTIYISK